MIRTGCITNALGGACGKQTSHEDALFKKNNNVRRVDNGAQYVLHSQMASKTIPPFIGFIMDGSWYSYYEYNHFAIYHPGNDVCSCQFSQVTPSYMHVAPVIVASVWFA